MRTPIPDASRPARAVLAMVMAIALATVGLVASAPLAGAAAGITVAVDVTDPMVAGGTGTIRATASNSGGGDLYNTSIQLRLPPAAVVDSLPAGATSELDGGRTIVRWLNLADLPAGRSVPVELSFRITSPLTPILRGAPGFTTATGIEVTAVASEDPVVVPRRDAGAPIFDPATYASLGTTTGDFEVVPFAVEKSYDLPEGELLRGEDDHRSVVTLVVRNSSVRATTTVTVTDLVPAGLEHMGCTAAAPIGPTCPTPSSVTTVALTGAAAAAAGVPDGVYTRLVWTLPSIATGGTATIRYAVGAPERANTTTWPGATPPSTGAQTANLDNNTGPLTLEPGGEQAVSSRVVVSGNYNGTIYTAVADAALTIEDLTVAKTVSTETFSRYSVSTWTLTVRTSAYTDTAAALSVVDTLPDGLCLVGGPETCPAASGTQSPSQTPTSAVVQSNGTTLIEWNPADLGPDATEVITFDTVTLASYRFEYDGALVRARDSWTNTVDVTGSVQDRSGTTRTIGDASSAAQRGGQVTLATEVADPVGGLCGDGSGLSWSDDGSGHRYGTGDLVCWRLTVSTDTPDLDTFDLVLTDVLPTGYEVVMDGPTTPRSEAAAGSDVALATAVAVADRHRIDWTFTSGDDESLDASVVLTSRVTGSPSAAAPGDVRTNVARLASEDNGGGYTTLRDELDVLWAEPELSLTKTVSPTPLLAGMNAPPTYMLTIANSGNAVARDVRITDVLPGQVEASAVTDTTAAAVGATMTAVPGNNGAGDDAIQWLVPSVPAGGTTVLTYTVALPDRVAPAQVVVNTATVTGFEADTTDPADPRQAYLPGTDAPAASASRSAPVVAATVTTTHTSDATWNTAPQATIGEVVTYTSTATLPRGTTVTGGVLSDLLPANLLLDSASVDAVLRSPGGALYDVITYPRTVTATADTAAVDLGTLTTPPDDEVVVVLTYSATVRDTGTNGQGGIVQNDATLTYTDASGIPYAVTSAADPLPIVEPSLTASTVRTGQSGSDPAVAEPGETIDFAVTVSNAGPSAAHDVVVVDTVPKGMTPLGTDGQPVADGATVATAGGLAPAAGSVWTATPTGPAAGTITWPAGGTLTATASGGSVPLTYRVRLADPLPVPSTFQNTVAVTATSMPGVVAAERDWVGTNASRYSATATSTITAPSLALLKTRTSPTTATIGEVVTWRLDVTVPPQSTVYDVTLLDSLPVGLEYVDGSATLDTSGAGNEVIVLTSARNGAQLAWSLGDLAPAPAPRTYRLTYQTYVTAIAGNTSGKLLFSSAVLGYDATDRAGDLSGTAVPASGTFDAVQSDQASVNVSEPRAVVDKSVVGGAGNPSTRRVVPGQTVTYTIEVRNTGGAVAEQLQVTDTADARMTGYTSTGLDPVSGRGWTMTEPVAGTRVFALDPLPVNETMTITYSLTVPALTVADEVVSGVELVNTAQAGFTSQAVGATYPGRAYASVVDRGNLEADLATVGDRVWLDVDGDGVQDAGEPGVADVGVTITYLGTNLGSAVDDEVHTTTTAANGSWSVDQLPGGSYTVAIAGTPAGTRVSRDPQRGTTLPLATASFTLAQNGSRTDIDFGLTGTGAIGDRVWLDADDDGAQDAGEPGIPGMGVIVTWAGRDGVPGNADDVARTAVTGVDGAWQVPALPAGDHVVEVSALPTGTQVSGQRGGGASGVVTVGLGDAQVISDADFGLVGTATASGTVWLEVEADGVVGSDEPGLPAATVSLRWDGIDASAGTADDVTILTTSGGDGGWEQAGLPEGSFQVVVTRPAEHTDLSPSHDPYGAMAGDPDGVAVVSLADGAAVTDADFGWRGLTSASGTVWLDLDGDATRDGSEPTLADVDVSVTWSAPDGIGVARTITTDEDGAWQLTGLSGGDWTATVPAPPAGTSITSAAGAPGVEVAATTAPDGSDWTTADLGLQAEASVGDQVWLDLDGDGDQGTGEPGLAGIDGTVSWAGPGGQVVLGEVTTAADGTWSMAGVPDGEITLTLDEASFPAGTVPGLDAGDSAGDTADGIGSVTVADGTSTDALDMALVGTGTARGRISLLVDIDGVTDPDLPGIGLTVTWFGPDGLHGTADDAVVSTATATDGAWSVGGLPAGLLLVTGAAGDLPAGTAFVPSNQVGGDGADAGGAPDGVTLSAGGEVTAELTAAGTGSVGDLVWLDHDGDATRDAGEPGMSGVTVTTTWAGLDAALGTGDDLTWSRVTAAGGLWSVPDVPAGPVLIAVAAPDGTTPVSDPRGDATVDGEVTLDLDPAETATDLDLGLRGTAAVSGLAWVDEDGDGLLRAGVQDEPGIPGARVAATWFGSDGLDGTGDELTVESDTAGDGTWSIDGLPAGVVRVAVVQNPDGLIPTTDPEVLADGDTADAVVLLSGDTRLLPGEDRTGLAFGFIAETGAGDRVWLDLNGDGIQDDGEPGIGGVEVTVTSAGADGVLGTGDDLATTTRTKASSDSSTAGGWLVRGLPSGPTRVAVTGGLPAGVAPTPSIDGSATTGPREVVLIEDEADLDLDFGFVGSASVGGRLWMDLDADGVQDDGEPGVGPTTISLRHNGADGVAGTGDDLPFVVDVAADGAWTAAGLPSGRVDLVTATPADLVVTHDETGGADGASSADLIAAEDHLTAGVGYRGSASPAGRVWFDLDGDDVFDDEEAGFGELPLLLRWAGADGVLGTADDGLLRLRTTTDGSWSAQGLPAGEYELGVDTAALSAEQRTAFAADPRFAAADGIWSGVLSVGESLQNLDAGLIGDTTVGERVFVDQDGDGVFDGDDSGMASVAVTLHWWGDDAEAGTDDDAVFATITEADGSYTTTGLPAGAYTVRIDPETVTGGATPASDSDGGDPTTTTLTIAPGQVRTGIDFALDPPPVPGPDVPPTDSTDPDAGPDSDLDSEPDRSPQGIIRLPRTGSEALVAAVVGLTLLLGGAFVLRSTALRPRRRTVTPAELAAALQDAELQGPGLPAS